MSDPQPHIESTLHDGVIETVRIENDALELVIDVPFVRGHHGRPRDHRYVVRCEGVRARRFARWEPPADPRPEPRDGETHEARVERDRAWAARGVFREQAWDDVSALVVGFSIVGAELDVQHDEAHLLLRGSDRSHAWCELEVRCLMVALSESDGTVHDAASFAALGAAYWDAWSGRQS